MSTLRRVTARLKTFWRWIRPAPYGSPIPPGPPSIEEIVAWLETLSDDEIAMLVKKLSPRSLMTPTQSSGDLILHFGPASSKNPPTHWWTIVNHP